MSTDYKNTPEDAAHFLKLVEKMTNPDQTPSDDPQIAIDNGDTEPDPVQIAEAGPAVADLEKIKELRKLLAGLLLEFRKLFKDEPRSLMKRMRTAILQAKVSRIEEADAFVELEDIQALTKLEMDLGEWISGQMERGRLNADPLAEMQEKIATAGRLVEDVFKLFEQSMQDLELPNPKKQKFRLEDLDAELKKMERRSADLLQQLAEYQECFKAEAWDEDGRLHTELVALDTIVGTGDPIGKLPHEAIRNLAFQKGIFWERHEDRCRERRKLLLQLQEDYYEEREKLEAAQRLCQKGDYRKARKILGETLGCFSELSYDAIKQQVEDWKLKAFEPYRELVALLPDQKQVRTDRFLEIETELNALADKKIRKQVRSIFNPVRLFLLKSNWLLKVGRYRKLCSRKLGEVEQLEPSDFRHVLLHRWDKGRERAESLVRQIRKTFNFHILKNTSVLGMITICGYSGFNLYQYGQKLPETIVEYRTEGLPLKSLQFEIGNKKFTHASAASNLGIQQLKRLTPGKYTITAKFADTFPMSFPMYVQLGKTTDLTNELARHFVDTRETTLQILSATGSQIRVQQEGSVQDAALEVDSRHLVATGNGVAWLSFDSTGKHLLATSWDSKTSNIRILDGKTIGVLNMDESPIVRAYFSPSGRYILTLAYNGTMGLWDALSGKSLSTFNQQGVRIVCSAFRPDGQSLVILDANHEIKEWKIPDGELAGKLKLPGSTKLLGHWTLAQLHPAWKEELPHGVQMRLETASRTPVRLHAGSDETIIAMITANNKLLAWAGSLKEMQSLEINIPPARSLEFHPTADFLLSTGLDGSSWLVNYRTGVSRVFTKPMGATIDQIVFSRSGHLVAIRSSHGIDLLSFPEGDQLHRIQGLGTPRGDLVLGPSGGMLAVAGQGNIIHLWNQFSTTRIHLLSGKYKVTVGANASPTFQKKLEIGYGEALRLDATGVDRKVRRD